VPDQGVFRLEVHAFVFLSDLETETAGLSAALNILFGVLFGQFGLINLLLLS